MAKPVIFATHRAAQRSVHAERAGDGNVIVTAYADKVPLLSQTVPAAAWRTIYEQFVAAIDVMHGEDTRRAIYGRYQW